MASADLRQELDCSICLNIYTDPVTLRCGHNFCRVCIDRVLDKQEGSGVYTCPECRTQYRKRPVLEKNRKLCNIAEHVRSIAEEETGIFCTYCVHSPVPALKSCLKCEASLCDIHWRTHNKSAEHVLVDPTTSLEKRKCSVHNKILEYYCTEDGACICVSCSLAGEHRGHLVETLDDASEKKKKKLRNVLQKLTTKREETEKRVQSLHERRREDQEKAACVTKRVIALFRDIRRQREDLEKSVLSEISRQEESISLSVSDLIQQLEIKKDELSRKMRHIEELCNMSDPVTVLQEPDTDDLCDTDELSNMTDPVTFFVNVEELDDISCDTKERDTKEGDIEERNSEEGDSEERDREEGDSEERDREEGDSEEGDIEDGDSEDENSEEGDSEEGESKEGNSEEGDSEEGESKEGNIEERNSEEGDSEEQDSEEGDIEEGDSEDENSEEGDSEEGDSEEGDGEEGDSEEGESKEGDIEERNSEEGDSEERDSEERDSEEGDSEDENSEEGNSEEGGSKEGDIEKGNSEEGDSEEGDIEEGYNEDIERHDNQVHDVGDLDVCLISGTIQRGLSEIITGINVCFYVQEATDILLDVNTAGNY
ncbi:uncharacterized protein LOC142150897 [Mixophyes fleayi]|uniref:uncharacterized protein LOC142150897 n=1 Tax=Mixophyes fleayi TaxID=3061075 RepID=UPI003F4DD877